MGEQKIRNMEEFASLSGISRPTVSKYFHDPESVKAGTRAKIEATLERYDYRPNIYAMNQNRKLTKTVGVVVPLLSDPYFAEIARNLEDHCIAAGYRPTLFSSHGNPAHEVEVLDTLRSLKPAGVFWPLWVVPPITRHWSVFVTMFQRLSLTVAWMRLVWVSLAQIISNLPRILQIICAARASHRAFSR